MVKQYGQKDLNERSETLKRDQKARREKFKPPNFPPSVNPKKPKGNFGKPLTKFLGCLD